MRMVPGSTSVVPIPKPATSCERASKNPSMPHFVAQYSERPGKPACPAPLDIWMMRPPPKRTHVRNRGTRKLDRADQVGIHDVPHRIQLQFFRRSEQAVSGITDDCVDAAHLLDGCHKDIWNIR